MIEHRIYHSERGFHYTWILRLPFRLNVGDFIDSDLLENHGELESAKEVASDYYKLFADQNNLVVEEIIIDHSMVVEAFVEVPKPLTTGKEKA